MSDDQEVDDEGAVEASSGREPSLGTFAGRLEYLFRTVHPPGQRPYSYEHVAETIGRDQGVEISANYIWMLRSGRRDNPTLRHIEALAKFFGVGVSFLIDQGEAERIRGQLTKLVAVRDSGVEQVALRGGTVDDHTLDAIHSLLDRARELTDGLRQARNDPREEDL